MNYDELADELMQMDWRDRLLQVIGLMCYVVTAKLPNSRRFKTMLDIVKHDLEQFIFRGSGRFGNISDDVLFMDKRDFLNEIYFPVVRLTAVIDIENQDLPSALEYSNGEPQSFEQISEFIIELSRMPDQDLDDLIATTYWRWPAMMQEC